MEQPRGRTAGTLRPNYQATGAPKTARATSRLAPIRTMNPTPAPVRQATSQQVSLRFAVNISTCFNDRGTGARYACDCSPNMWWNHGGVLNGGSPPRIQFFREYAENAAPAGTFKHLRSSTLSEGVYMLHDAATGYRLIFWDNMQRQSGVVEHCLDECRGDECPCGTPIKLTLEQPSHLTQVDYNQMRLKQLRTVATGLLEFTPGSNDFVLEIKAA